MKPIKLVFLLLVLAVSPNTLAQMPTYISDIFPKGTVFHQNIAYANDTLKKHLLDLYIPANPSANIPLVVWVHGGAWMVNDKYADMSYMTGTVKMFIEKGYALASIDYRHSTTAIFPAQIQDCNQAIQFLYDHASTYKLDKNRISLIGFSAGGHLASLLALSNNSNIPDFYVNKKKPSFQIKAVLDFYGPSNLLLFFSTSDLRDIKNPIATLLGVSPLIRPDVSNIASPVTYVDKNDPPFFIVHGEKDMDVPRAQSYLLKSYLDLVQVKSEITIVKDAPHYGKMFDSEEIRAKLFTFLETNMK
ncbi:MAG: alpha/beta hydrolase [Chryseolinea sp.]